MGFTQMKLTSFTYRRTGIPLQVSHSVANKYILPEVGRSGQGEIGIQTFISPLAPEYLFLGEKLLLVNCVPASYTPRRVLHHCRLMWGDNLFPLKYCE